MTQVELEKSIDQTIENELDNWDVVYNRPRRLQLYRVRASAVFEFVVAGGSPEDAKGRAALDAREAYGYTDLDRQKFRINSVQPIHSKEDLPEKWDGSESPWGDREHEVSIENWFKPLSVDKQELTEIVEDTLYERDGLEISKELKALIAHRIELVGKTRKLKFA